MKRNDRRSARRVFGALLGVVLSAAAGCMPAAEDGQAAAGDVSLQAELTAEAAQEEPAAGLILTSRDAEENESIIAGLEEMAESNGIRLLVYTPDVSAAEAEEAGGLEMGSFASCDVNPIEYQMLGVNEFAAENVDVIAIHANHSEALESVLTAARGIGIRICAWGCEVQEGCFDTYVDTASEIPDAVLELLELE